MLKYAPSRIERKVLFLTASRQGAASGYGSDAARQSSSRSSGHAKTRSPRLIPWWLRVLSVGAPALFVVALELLHAELEKSPDWSPGVVNAWRLALLAAVIISIAVFATVMMSLIGRAERAIVLRNRDLTAANDVSAAAQAATGSQEILDEAALALARTSGADAVRLRLEPTPGRDGAMPIEAIAGPVDVLTAATPAGLDLPLLSHGTEVGRLQIWSTDLDHLAGWFGASTVTTLATQVVGAVQHAQAVDELYRRKNEGHVFYDVLMKISNQDATLETLNAIAHHARDSLGADASAIVLNAATADSVRFDSGPEALQHCSDDSTVLGCDLPDHFDPVTGDRVNPIGCQHWASETLHELVGPSGELGFLWVGRYGDHAFSERDGGFLGTLAGLAAVALTSALVREGSRQRAVLNERTRIAREMHDSLAQVLGAVHLRLRMLETAPAIAAHPDVTREVTALADVCDEAYRDVREVILGLRDSNKAFTSLDENLRAYCGKYATQSGIATEFVNRVGEGLTLSPRAEVHLIRVVQEALTNVRKHAKATRATVTVTSTDTSTVFTVADDGRGFAGTPGEAGNDGYGLFTMRDRLALIGGSLEVTSAPGEGTRVVATVPERARSLAS
jgi:signal transduction histidine kinase